MGYPPYYQDPDASYPAIDNNDKELNIDRHAVKKIIDDLRDNDLNKYVSQHGALGLPDDLASKGRAIHAQDVGGVEGGDAKSGYPAAQKVMQIIQRVNDPQNGFPALYGNFVQSYQNVINALYDTAGVINDAEHNSEVPNSGSQNSSSNSSYDNTSQT
jgi:hypothetical protein